MWFVALSKNLLAVSARCLDIESSPRHPCRSAFLIYPGMGTDHFAQASGLDNLETVQTVSALVGEGDTGVRENWPYARFENGDFVFELYFGFGI